MYTERIALYRKYAAYIAVNNTDIEETVSEIETAYHSILINAVKD